MKDEALVKESQAVLAHHARSFRWAQVLLPKEQAQDAAVVYAFCRLADDTADEAPDFDTARDGLNQLLAEFENPTSARPLVRAFVAIIERCDIPKDVVRHLFDGLLADLQAIRTSSDEELLHYCYQVAGTVGLMMCGVLRVRDPAALRHAVDLGVGMQISNICRDVYEDLSRDRIYLPASRLLQKGIAPESLFKATEQPAGLDDVLMSLLDLADRHYESADHGMRYIPWRARFAIVAAARIYRGIGWKIRKRRGQVWRHRERVGILGKMRWMVVALIQAPLMPFLNRKKHPKKLHATLNGKMALPTG
jgi:phytoene synthase